MSKIGKERGNPPLVVTAARAVTVALKEMDVTCIIVGQLGEYLQGNAKIPESRIKAAILSSTASATKLSQFEVAKRLVEYDPAHFCFTTEADGRSRFMYRASAAGSDEILCSVTLKAVKAHTPASSKFYDVERHVEKQGLWVIPSFSMSSILEILPQIWASFIIATIQSDYDGNWVLPKNQFFKLRRLLTQPKNNSTNSTHFPLSEEDVDVIKNVATLLPDFAFTLLKLIPPADALLQEPNDNRQQSEIEASTPSSSNPPAKLSRDETISFIAKDVADTLGHLGFQCAFFGSLACRLYGNDRPPNDIDLLVVSPPKDQVAEELKWRLVKHDPIRFFLVNPKDPEATYKVLYYRINPDSVASGIFYDNRCKLDVLFPGTLSLPSLTADLVVPRDGLPVVPFSVLLLQKLQGWDDHRSSSEQYQYKRHVTDAEDIRCLLQLEHLLPLQHSQPWNDRILFEENFMAKSIVRVQEFCSFHPACKGDFRNLGFQVDS